jgi:hypothetical protein
MRHNKKNGKVIHADVSLQGLTLDIAAKRKDEALPTVRKVLDGLLLHLPTGERVYVDVELDDLALGAPIFKQASAAPLGLGKYKISIGVGLVTQLSVIARSMAADKNELRGRTKTQLLRADVRSAGRESALADFVFHFMLCFVLWHEVAHVALGHLDWLKQKTDLNIITEFGYVPMPDNVFTQLQTLEADADRQASLWCTSMIDYAAQSNPFLRYTSRADLFYDIGYIYGTLFGFLDAVDSRPEVSKRKHPKSDIRLGVALAFIEDYLNKTHVHSAKLLQKQVISGGINALSRSIHNKKELLDPFAIFAFMSENGTRLDKMGIRSFQHKVSSAAIGSFHVLN